MQCKGRDLLLMEEEQRPLPEPGQPVIPRPSKEDLIALPKCTTEGVGYVLECWPCRLQGLKFRYVGETSRSGHQRAAEHQAEISAGKKTHPMEIYIDESYQGIQQEILMRIVK